MLGNTRPPGLPRRASPGEAASASEPVEARARGWPPTVSGWSADEFAPAADDAPARSEPAPEQVGRFERLIRLSRAHAGTIGVIMVVALVLTGTRLMSARGHDIDNIDPSPVITPATPSATPSAAEPSQPPIRVHVLGAVSAPGVVSLPAQSRVADAIEAAGGLAADADCGELNLAAPVPDGAQIIIGTTAEPRGELRTDSGAGPADSAGPQSGPATLNLNTATAAQLETLPGIGPVTAQAILAWREAHGTFTRIEELLEVDGIGPKTFDRLAPLVHV